MAKNSEIAQRLAQMILGLALVILRPAQMVIILTRIIIILAPMILRPAGMFIISDESVPLACSQVAFKMIKAKEPKEQRFTRKHRSWGCTTAQHACTFFNMQFNDILKCDKWIFLSITLPETTQAEHFIFISFSDLNNLALHPILRRHL